MPAHSSVAAIEDRVVGYTIFTLKECIQIAGFVSIIYAHAEGINKIAKAIILPIVISSSNSRIASQGDSKRRIGISSHGYLIGLGLFGDEQSRLIVMRD